MEEAVKKEIDNFIGEVILGLLVMMMVARNKVLSFLKDCFFLFIKKFGIYILI